MSTADNFTWLETVRIGLGDVCDGAFDQSGSTADRIAGRLAAIGAATTDNDPTAAASANLVLQRLAKDLRDNLVRIIDWNDVSVIFALIRAEAAARMEQPCKLEFPDGGPQVLPLSGVSVASAVPINEWLAAAFRRTTDSVAAAAAAALASGLGDSSPSDRCTSAFARVMGVFTVGAAVRVFHSNVSRLRRQHLLGQLEAALARSGCPAAEIRVVIAEVRALPSLCELGEHEDRIWREFCAGHREAQSSWREALRRFFAMRSEALAAKVPIIDAATDPDTGLRSITLCLTQGEWDLGVVLSDGHRFSECQSRTTRGWVAPLSSKSIFIKVTPGSVGDRCGLLNHDVLLKVGETDVVGLPVGKVSQLLKQHGFKKNTAFTLVVAPAARFRFHDDLATPGPAPFRRPDPAVGHLKSAAGPVFDWNGEEWVQPSQPSSPHPHSTHVPLLCPGLNITSSVKVSGDNVDGEASGPEGDEDTLDWHAAATLTLAARQRRAEAAFDELAEALDQCDLVSASCATSVCKCAIVTFFDHHKLYRLGYAEAPANGIAEISDQIERHGTLWDQAELVAAFRAKQEETSTAAAPAVNALTHSKQADRTTSSPPTRGRRVNPVLQMLLAGTRDPDCPLSVLRGHQDVLEMLWLKVIQIYADQLDTTSPAYSILHRVRVKFPPSQGLQVNMMPFKLEDMSSLPAECQQWWPMISTCTSHLSGEDLVEDDNGAAIGYLTIDERDTGGGASHRRGGLHTESPGSSFVMGSGEPVREAPRYHHWGIGMQMGDRKFGGGIFMSSNVPDSTAVYSASVVRPQDADDPEAAAGMIGQLGDCEHLRPAVAHTRRTLGANELLWMTDMSLHESLPIAKPVHRQYFRLVTRNIGAWYEHHSTPNPLKVTPPPGVRIIKTSKFGDDGHEDCDEAKAEAARTIKWKSAGLTSAL